MDEKLYVFAWEATEDRRGSRVGAFLEQHAVRVQPGLFEIVLPPEGAEFMMRRLHELLEPSDRLRAYAIPLSHIARAERFGGAPLPEPGRFWIL